MQDLTVQQAHHLALHARPCLFAPRRHRTMLHHVRVENTQDQVGLYAPPAAPAMNAIQELKDNAQPLRLNTQLAAKQLAL